MLQQCTMPPRNIRTAKSNEQKQSNAVMRNALAGRQKVKDNSHAHGVSVYALYCAQTTQNH
jgi:hypothetical protein